MTTDQPELDPADPIGVPTGEGFNGPKVCDIVGITYRQLDYWARTDLIRPSIADAAGSGTQRRYSYRDLVELKVVKSLLDAGVSLQSARKAVAYFREHVGRDLATASLVIDGKNSVVTRSGDDLLDLVKQGQGVLNIVPIGSMVEELDAPIVELDAQIVELDPGATADDRASPHPDDGVMPPRAAAED